MKGLITQESSHYDGFLRKFRKKYLGKNLFAKEIRPAAYLVKGMKNKVRFAAL